jgi:hypothetical protein
MTTVVARTRQPIPPADERYRDAIDALRKAFGRRQGFEEAKAWALWLCNEVEHTNKWQNDPHEMSQQDRLYLRTWTSAARAAKTLAQHLEISGADEEAARVDEAARRAGVKLTSNNKEAIDVAFAKILRELAKQPFSLHGKNGGPYVHGPLLVFMGKRFRLPSKPMSLAFALIYGFRKATGAIARSPKPGSYFTNWPRFDLLSGGKACYDAVRLFVNTTFNTTLDNEAIIKSLQRYKQRRIDIMCSLVED